MSTLFAEMEDELESELEMAHESQEAHEHENEAEDEQFFNNLAAMADRSGRSQALRRIAMAAARAAMKGRQAGAPGIEGEGEGEFAAEAQELELEWNPVRRAYVNAELEHLGHAAAEAATEKEAAEHFLPLIPLAAKFALPLLAKAAPFVAKAGGAMIKKLAPKILGKVAPQLTRGVSNVTRMLYRNPTTRPLVHAMPRIARGTVVDLARRVAAGRNVNAQTAVRALARRTAQTLSQPRTLAQAYQNSRVGDSRYHGRARRLLGTPVGGGVRANGSHANGAAHLPGMGPSLASGVSGSPASYGSRLIGFCPTCGRPM